MTPQELKNSILQLAIQGKLVEQRPEDGTAAELLEKIARHGTTGTHGTTKTTGTTRTKSRAAHRASSVPSVLSVPSVSSVPVVPSVPDDEKPFDIPESWEWVRLGDVASIERGSGIKRSETSSRGFPCVRYGEIYTTYGYSFTSTKSFVAETVASSCHKANHGDVLCTLTGEWKEEIAKATAYLGKAPIAVGGDLARISSQVFDPVLLVYFFFAPFMIQQKASKANGTMIVHIGKEAVSNLLIPLPPLAEQKRIVAKIEELLPLIDRYEKAWSKLEDFNRRFPVDMQKSVLQMAIQGKLVDQRPEEGTGEELLEKILRDGTHKTTGTHRTKSRTAHRASSVPSVSSVPVVPSVPDDEKPFDIPESWVWARLGQLGNTNIGLTYGPKDVCDDGVVVLRSSNIQNEKMNYADIVRVSCSIPESKMCHVGDILICARNGSKRLVGKAALIDREGMSFGAFMAIFRSCCNAYVLYVINSAYFRNALLGDTGTTTINQITQDMMKNMPIPLPPLAEQKRIVAKLEEILPLCERLK